MLEKSIILGIMPYAVTDIFSSDFDAWVNLSHKEIVADLTGFTEKEIRETFSALWQGENKLNFEEEI